MTIRLSSFALVFAAGLATTASADVIGRDSGPPRRSEASASHYLFLLHVVNVEREKKAARQWLSEQSPEEREEVLGGIARSLGELAGHFNELVAKAEAPETRDDVFILIAEEMCKRREWVIDEGGDDGFWCPGRRRGQTPIEEMEIPDGPAVSMDRMGKLNLGNVFLLKLLDIERRRKIMRRWFSELSTEDRSEMIFRGTRWLTGVADHLDELAAKAAAPETREDVFAVIAQKRCEGFSFSDFGHRDSSSWCGYGRAE